MLGAAFLACILVLTRATLQGPSGFDLGNRAVQPRSPSSQDGYGATCEKIARSISSASQVFYPWSQDFDSDIAHWTNSSSQVSACSVEPGTPNDVGLILREIAHSRVSFAVKGGGHAYNPGFSSTLGVHISMARFKDIIIHEERGTVEIGAGLTWTDVYAYLVPKGLNVVGGRLNGVGVAGLTLGGGYSWKTNEYGLTMDTVTEFEVVLPCGEVKVVTEQDEDLWFALKGGFNNYGIVTKFTLKSHTQTDVWGALLSFGGDLADPAQTAFANYIAQQHDPRAAQLGSFVYSNGSVLFGISLFYDGPSPPEGLYDDLLNMPTTTKSIFNGSFTDFVSTQFIPLNKRAYFDGVPMLHYTKPIMEAFTNETQFWGDRLSQYDDNVLVAYGIDPFEPDILTHGGPSAYPPDRSRVFLPSSAYRGWTNESADEHMADSLRLSTAALIEAGTRDGQDLENAAPYVNYALFGTPLELMYGSEHLKRLAEIKQKYDPGDIMGLTGGWKL
ncbi:FAD-binding domain-containing protein [Russula earlei]|uniref:FAD-binding domain-containing protein n=1 Tax=Russula earlei TaxID=71964 RepID=A0ACC0U0B0_9AGAM|nr:FAD-binding domain-containing protein [Russula earlei]